MKQEAHELYLWVYHQSTEGPLAGATGLRLPEPRRNFRNKELYEAY